MKALTRFWLILLGALVTISSFIYLFISLAFPGQEMVQTSLWARMGALAIGLVSTSIMVLAVVVIEVDYSQESLQ